MGSAPTDATFSILRVCYRVPDRCAQRLLALQLEFAKDALAWTVTASDPEATPRALKCSPHCRH